MTTRLFLTLRGALVAISLIFSSTSALAAPITLFAPWNTGDRWIAGSGCLSGGSYYGQGYHTGSDYYAIDFNGVLNASCGSISGDDGKEIRAVNAGSVSAIGQDPTAGYGYNVVLDHGSGVTSRYAHLKYNPTSSPGLSVGQQIARGQTIGYNGSTGYSSAPHLHFALYQNTAASRPDPMDGASLCDSCNGTLVLSSNSGIPVPNAPSNLAPNSSGATVWLSSVALSWTDNLMSNGQPSASFTVSAWRSTYGTRGSQVISSVSLTSGGSLAFPGSGYYEWQVTAHNGLSGADARSATSASGYFNIKDQFDYTQDGKNDIIWRNTSTGSNTFWAMDGPAYIGPDSVEAVTDQNWQIVGSPDYTRDGKPDLLWQNRTLGSATFWAMNGPAHTGSDAVASGISSNWKIVGTPDYDGDGYPDILWRNQTTGQNVYWKMVGTAKQGNDIAVETVSDTNWEIVGTPDYDNDGKTDLLWRNKVTGSNTYWKMDGATHNGSDSINAVTDTNWKIVGTPDYNRDGKTDILWRNTSTGSNTYWAMNGPYYIGPDSVQAVTDTNWQIVAVH